VKGLPISVPIPEIGSGLAVLATTERELIVWTKLNLDITGWTLSADAVGECVLRVEMVPYTTFPAWQEVMASSRPTLTNAQKATGTLSTPVAVRGETAWRITVISAATVKNASLSFHGTRV